MLVPTPLGKYPPGWKGRLISRRGYPTHIMWTCRDPVLQGREVYWEDHELSSTASWGIGLIARRRIQPPIPAMIEAVKIPTFAKDRS